MRRSFTLASAFVAALSVAWTASPVSAAGLPIAPSHAATSQQAARGAHTESATTPATASSPTPLAAFAGGGEQAAIAAAGSGISINTTPADPSVAAGANDVVEAVNSALFIYTRTGTQIGPALSINKLVGTSAGWAVKYPHVVYDPLSGRFILAVLQYNTAISGCNNAQSQIEVAVSGADPTGMWLPTRTFNNEAIFGGTDQPVALNLSLGMTSTVVDITWDYTDCADTAGVHSQTDIIQRADLTAGALGVSSAVALTNGPPGVQPALAPGLTTVEYAVANDESAGSTCAPVHTGAGSFVVVAITGTPDQRNVAVSCSTWTESTATAAPPSAPQPGTSAVLSLGDDRFLSATWSNNQLLAAGNTTCTPSGDTGPRSCINVVSATATSSGSVSAGTQLAPEGVVGKYLYYPSIAVDSTGDVFTTFDESSSSMLESMEVATITGTTWSSFITLQPSLAFYAPGGCTLCTWGDYSQAVQDPLHPTDVWVVSEDNEGNDTGSCTNANTCWNTYIGRYTFAGPSVSLLTPNSGTGGGGQLVTVSGSDFASGSTAVIGSTPIPTTNLTPDSFTFITPPGPTAGGVEHVIVTDSLGSSSSTSTQSGYLYVPLADYNPVVPFRILDTRGPPVHALGSGATMTLHVVGVGPAGSTPVPSTAVAVVLNVTEVNGSANSLLTVYPAGAPTRPTASNLNFAPGTVEANLVTVMLGTGGSVNIYNSVGTVNVVVDVEGYFAPPLTVTTAGEFHPIPPVRVCDTRITSPTPPCKAHGPLVGTKTMVVNVTGGTIPSDGTAAAVVLNITGVVGTAPAFLSVFPTTATGTCAVPQISTLNLLGGTVVANRVMVRLGPSTLGGPATSVCVYLSAGKINVVMDANGWYGSATAAAGYQYQAIAPSRICDTRIASPGCTTGAITYPTSRLVHVAGEGGVPATGPVVQAVIANLTGIGSTAATFMVAFPSNLTTTPNASDVNLKAHETLPNLVVVQLDTTAGPDFGCIQLFNDVGSINAVLDIEGWFQ